MMLSLQIEACARYQPALKLPLIYINRIRQAGKD
ncbi:hypothetical protein Q668_12090 [Alcanivorax sp. PN-3]|nr:hypothetical protein Q668_12090 [Alcanivorax sp. PN-3]